MNNTPCKMCVFAEWDGFTQTGCERGMIEKYRNYGNNIIEAYDEEAEFYVIEGRLCPFYREENWLKRFKNPENKKTIEAVLRFETSVAFHYIVFIRQDTTEKQIKKTIETVSKQDLKPLKVTFIRNNNSKIKAKEVSELLKNSKFAWRIENLLGDMSDEKSVHMVQKSVNAPYYAISEIGVELDENFFRRISDMVSNEIQLFGMIDLENIKVIPKTVYQHWYYQGDRSKTVVENIRDYQCQNPEEKVVLTKI